LGKSSIQNPTIVAIATIESRLHSGQLNKAGDIRVLIQELTYLNAEIATAENDDYFQKFGSNVAISIPRKMPEGKGVFHEMA
jgi:hypothetical protein